VLSKYKVRIARQARAHVEQSWCAADVIIDTAPPRATVVTLQHKCSLDLRGYDVFRVFASPPARQYTRRRSPVAARHTQGATRPECHREHHGLIQLEAECLAQAWQVGA
jgi:hypothetical protein